MFKKISLPFLSLFLVLFANNHLKAQIVYPDKAIFNINNLSTLIDFESYNSLYPEYDFGPDAAIQFKIESDSIVAFFGHSDISLKIKAANFEDFKDPSKVNFIFDKVENGLHYKGTKNVDPGYHDYLVWPHTQSFTGKDGHLYAIGYVEFTGWTVYGYNTPECPSENYNAIAFECWMSSAILVKSVDGGSTWDKAGDDPSEYVVATSPYKYREENNTERHGAFPPSTAIGSDFYGLKKVGEYFYIHVEFWGEGFKIGSIARTNDITNASSWRYFDGEDFTIPNVNPYYDDVTDPASHLPPPIDNYYPLNINPNNEPVEGILYSTYFEKYITTRHRSYSFAPEVKPGVYYYLSEDGFNWSGNALLIPFKDNFDKYDYPGDSEPYWGIWYQSIIDQVTPNSYNATIGKDAYLVYVDPLVNGEWSPATNNIRDINYIPVSFDTHSVSSFEVTHTNLTIPEDPNPGDGYCDNGYGRCSLITAITESENRPAWIDTSIPLTITIGDSAPDTLTEDYLARINKRTIIDGTAHQDFSVNTLEIEDGWNGTYGVHIKPGFVFESGKGHELKGIDVQSVDVGGGEDGSQISSVSITQSKINTLTLNNAHTGGVQVGGFSADSANIIGNVVFAGAGNIVRGNLIGHNGNSLMNTYGVNMGFTNTLESNVIVGKDNGILINVTSDDNKIINNHIGYLPWSNSSLASQGAGIKLTSASNNHIEGNTIKFTNSDEGEAALFINGADNNKIYSNVISNNSGIGIHVSGTSKGNFVGDSDKGNTINSNGYGVSFLVNTETGNPVIGNKIFDNPNGSIGQYSNIQKLAPPTLYSAYVNSTNDSLIINHSSISETSSENFLVDIFSNSSSPTIPQGENIIISKLSITSDDLSTKTLALPYTGSSNVFISTTFTDDRLVTSEFSNVVQLFPETSSPSASYSFSSLSADHTSNWYSEHMLQITNNGSTDLILQLEEDLGWVNLDLNLDADGKYVPFTVASGETKNLTIYFDSRDLSDEINSHTGSITINSNEIRPTLRSLPVEITFDTGETDWLTLSEDSVSLVYKIPNQDSTITKTLSLTNNNSDAVNWRMSKNQGWIMGLSPKSGTVQSGTSTDVTITFVLKANDPEGSKRATLVLFAGTVPENETATEIPFVINMVPKNVNDVIISPDSIEVNTRQPFTNIEITTSISITNFGDPNLQWRIHDNQPWIAPVNESGTINSGTKEVQIILHVNSTDPVGPKSGLLTVYTGYEGGQETPYEIPIVINITPNKPVISFNVDTLKATFQRPNENSTGTATFVLYNQSSDSINWMAFKNQGWITGLEPAGGKIKDSVEVTVSFRLRPNDQIGFKNAKITTAAFFDDSEEQTQAELPVRLIITGEDTDPLPKIDISPSQLFVTDTLAIGESFEEFIDITFNNLGTPGVNFQYVQSLSSFAQSNPFNGQFNTKQDVRIKLSFNEVQEKIYMDTVLSYKFFYPKEEMITLEIPIVIDINLEGDQSPQTILVEVKPDSITDIIEIKSNDSYSYKREIVLKNNGESGVNWSVLLPDQVQGKKAISGILSDSLVLPFEIIFSDINESKTIREDIVTRFWYDDSNDTLITIPLALDILYQPEEPKINIAVEPNSFNLQKEIKINDTLFIKEQLVLRNFSESEINWEVNIPFDQNSSTRISGTITDSLTIPIEFFVPNINSSFIIEDNLETRFWYNENNDTTVIVPFKINIDVIEETKINVLIEPSSYVLQKEINLNDTLFIEEKLTIKNLSQTDVNWEINIPFNQSNTTKLSGTLSDSLIIPIEFFVPNISTSIVIKDNLETRLWYNEKNDTTILIPFEVSIDVINVSSDIENVIPNEITLYQNYPNPFNPTTNIEFSLPKTEYINISLFNLSGQKVMDIVEGNFTAGKHTITINATNISSGTYVYQLKTSKGVTTKKMTLIK